MFKLWALLAIVALNDIASVSTIENFQLNPPFELSKNIERIAYDCYGECPNDQLTKIFLLANRDKTKYCNCKYGIPYLQECRSNLVFSLEEGECLDPMLIKSTNTTNLTNLVQSLWEKTSAIFGSRGNSSQERENDLRCIGVCSNDIENVATLLPHQDCSKFCLCKNGNTNVKTCSENLEFDAEEGACVSHGKSQCKNSNIQSKPSYDCVRKCPPVENLTGAMLIAHDDCLKYCLCKKNGAVIVKNCPKNYHFSPEQGTCLKPEEAKCDRLHGTVTTLDGCIGSCSNTEDPFKACFLAHEDCNKYCICRNLNITVKNCPPGLHFHLESQKCTKKEVAGCEPPPVGCIIECPPVFIDNVTCSTAHIDCDKYCLCVDGRPIEKHCPEGLHFSVDEGICVDPIPAGCNTTTPPPTTTTTTTTTTTPAPIPEGCYPSECDLDPNKACFIKHSNCSMYCKCYQGEITIVSCPEGLHFSLDYLECVKPEIAGCENPKKDPCDHTCDLSRNCKWPTDDCTKFCLCNDGEMTLEDCPDGLNFSPTIGMCVRPDIAGCDNFANTTTTTTTTPAPAPAEGCNNQCYVDDDPDRICLDPNEDCTKFCVCHNGLMTVENCPTGLHYNPELMICMDPAIAGCVPYDCIGECPDYEIPGVACMLSHADCTKYCHCIRGNPVVKNCYSGLHFSWDLARCDDPYIVECDRINGIGPSSSTSWLPHGSTDYFNRHFYAKEIDSEDCVGNCPSEDIFDIAVVLSHKDQFKYCHCIKGRTYAELCPGNSRFNIAEAKCVN